MTYGHIGQQEAQRILSDLRGRRTPSQPEVLSLYTVGDRFHQMLLKLRSDIIGLLSSPTALERIIIGDFGTGKSHFLRYLDWILRSDLEPIAQDKEETGKRAPICIITNVNLEELPTPGDLQRTIIQRMRMVGHSGDWMQVFIQSYMRILTKIKENKNLGLVTDKNVEKFISLVIFSVLENWTLGILGRDLFEYLQDRKFLKGFFLRLPFNKLETEYQQAIGSAGYDRRQFTEAFLRAVTSPDKQHRAELEAVMNRLSQQLELTDVVFKILALADVDLVIILVDELEELGSRPDGNVGLSAIKKLRDDLSKAGYNRPDVQGANGEESGYPSVALVCASTDLFFDTELESKHSALYDRWRSKALHIRLEPLSAADTDNLIFRLRELSYLSGSDLPPVKDVENESHEVIETRKEVMNKFQKRLEEKPPTTRDIIEELIQTIEQRAVVA